jgi:hypothetical protein
MDTGEKSLDDLRRKASEERVEDVGAKLRSLMHREEGSGVS